MGLRVSFIRPLVDEVVQSGAHKCDAACEMIAIAALGQSSIRAQLTSSNRCSRLLSSVLVFNVRKFVR